jgi:hypothetical protein
MLLTSSAALTPWITGGLMNPAMATAVSTRPVNVHFLHLIGFDLQR